MSERQSPPPIPHFLRVLRSIARVSSVAAPVAVVVTSVAPGCGGYTGVEVGDYVYDGGIMGTTFGGGGAGGGPVGVTAMDAGPPDAASGDGGGYDGGPVGDMAMPDAGSGDGG